MINQTEVRQEACSGDATGGFRCFCYGITTPSYLLPSSDHSPQGFSILIKTLKLESELHLADTHTRMKGGNQPWKEQ